MLQPIECTESRWFGINGDSLLLQASAPECAGALLPRFSGAVQTIYLDPPFNTGKTFEAHLPVGEEANSKGKGNFTLEAYCDRYPDKESYLSMMRDTLHLCRELLSSTGMIFLHCDGRMTAYLRLLMDEVFGENNFLNEIIWSYQSGGRSRSFFPRKHDTILFYARTNRYAFNLHAVPIGTIADRGNHMRRDIDEDGRSYRAIRSAGKEYRYYDDAPVYPGDVWTDIAHLQQRDPERMGFETQKPLALLRRVIACSSQEGDLVADLFCGSGTTAAAAQEMNRRFLCCDRSMLSMALTEKRLADRDGLPKRGYTARIACRMDGGAEATIFPAIATYTVYLTDFECPDAPENVCGMDAADRWAVGFLRDGVFYCCAASTRSRKHPALAKQLEMPVYGGEPCVEITDVLGNRRYFLPTRRV